MDELDPQRPKGWPDRDKDFKSHPNVASWVLMVLVLPLMFAAVAVGVYWLL